MQQLLQEQKDICGLFVHTSEPATYTNLLLATVSVTYRSYPEDRRSEKDVGFN
jgi:hypothetical protein